MIEKLIEMGADGVDIYSRDGELMRSAIIRRLQVEWIEYPNAIYRPWKFMEDGVSKIYFSELRSR